MLVVETIEKIRRAYFIQEKSIKQICRELRVSRNTVRKVVRSGAAEFSYLPFAQTAGRPLARGNAVKKAANVVAIALANKIARDVLAMLTKNQDYQDPIYAKAAVA